MAGASPDSAIKVACITGSGRSGSTILGNILGEIDGYFHAGELRTLWGQALLRGRRCGCGERVRDCPFWTAVLQSGFGPKEDWPDPAEVYGWQREAVRLRYTYKLVRGASGSRALDLYAGVSARLFAAIAEVTGARVIVDSSKRPAHAATLRLMPDIESYFIHLVRDPRAQAYSWRRQKAAPGHDRGEMVRYGPWTSTWDWTARNLAIETFRRSPARDRYLRVRYEDFVTNPRATLDALTTQIGEQAIRLPLLDGHRVSLSPNHTVGGNPGRFSTGTVELRLDEEWMTRQSTADRVVATTLALPLLSRYGYRLRPKAGGAEPSRSEPPGIP